MDNRVLRARTAKKSAAAPGVAPKKAAEFSTASLMEIAMLAALAKAMEQLMPGRNAPADARSKVRAPGEEMIESIVKTDGLKALSALRLAAKGQK